MLPPLPGRPQVRVVEVLATGGSGGAQEHLYSLLSRLDRSRFEPSVVSLSPGPTTRKIARLGVSVLVLDEPDDATAVGALAAYMAGIRPDVIHNHMYRAELVGTRAAMGLAEVGLPRPYVVSTVHSSRVRSAEDRAQLRLLAETNEELSQRLAELLGLRQRNANRESRLGERPLARADVLEGLPAWGRRILRPRRLQFVRQPGAHLGRSWPRWGRNPLAYAFCHLGHERPR